MSRYRNDGDDNNNTRRFTTDDENNSRGINRNRFRERENDDFGDTRSRNSGRRSHWDDRDNGSYARQLYGRDDDPTQPGRQHPGQNRAAWDWDRDNDHHNDQRNQFGRTQDYSFDEDRGYRARQGRQPHQDYGRFRDTPRDNGYDGHNRSRHLRDEYDDSGDVERHLSGYGSGGRGYSPSRNAPRYDRDDGDYSSYGQQGQSRDYGRSSQQGGQYGQQRGSRGAQGGGLRDRRDRPWQDYD
jgi:hypothetical protein